MNLCQWNTEPGLEHPKLKEMRSELPAACGEAGKSFGEPALKSGAQVRQLVSELALAFFPPQSHRLQGRGWAALPCRSLHLFSSEGEMILR